MSKKTTKKTAGQRVPVLRIHKRNKVLSLLRPVGHDTHMAQRRRPRGLP